MMDPMAVNPENGPVPLYLHAMTRILREMRIVQQDTNSSFDYLEFKRKVTDVNMTPGQEAPLSQHLDTLESFMPQSQTRVLPNGKKRAAVGGNDWTAKVRKSMYAAMI